jgi:hypothetical protein
MAPDELFNSEHHRSLNVSKVLAELDKLLIRKEEIENEFLQTQHQYDLQPSEPLLSRMGDIYILLEQAEEDIELLQELAMYASNREDRKNLMWGDR